MSKQATSILFREMSIFSLAWLLVILTGRGTHLVRLHNNNETFKLHVDELHGIFSVLYHHTIFLETYLQLQLIYFTGFLQFSAITRIP